ncbi:unnamed protein product [Caenorhabditis brenneri]
MLSNYSLRNGSRKRPHAQNAWKPEFQPIFDVLRSGFRYSKGERCRDEDRHTYVEEVLMSEYLEVSGDMTTFETCDLVRTKIVQPIKNFEDTEGVPKEAKRRATEIREKIEQKLEEIAQSRNLCCSQEKHFFALNEAAASRLRCGRDEESTLLDIFREFSTKKSSAFFKKNQLRTKNGKRGMSTDLRTDEVGSSDVVADADAALVIKKRALNNKKSKLKQEYQKKEKELPLMRIKMEARKNEERPRRRFVEEQENSSNPVTVELEVAVARDDLNIEIIPLEQRSAILEEKSDANENKEEKGEEKWDIVYLALKKVANILNKRSFLTSPLPIYNEAVEVFRTNRLRCGHQRGEESRLLDIFREFSRKMSLAFCCGKFHTASQMETRAMSRERIMVRKQWKNKRDEKTIYRHFKPEAYEECGKCKIVWHPKCRQLRLVKNRNGHPCQSSNDMVEIPNFSKAIFTTPFQRRLFAIYYHNRGDLPELTFIHSKCIKKIPDNTYTKNALPVREDFEYTANQIFVTVLIENVDTMIFSRNTQEYRSGPRKIFREFSRKMSLAFCCGKFHTASQVYTECKGHKTTCNIHDGDSCYVNGKDHCAE